MIWWIVLTLQAAPELWTTRESSSEEVKDSRENLEEQLKKEVEESRECDRTMNSLKPNILDLRNLRDTYVV